MKRENKKMYNKVKFIAENLHAENDATHRQKQYNKILIVLNCAKKNDAPVPIRIERYVSEQHGMNSDSTQNFESNANHSSNKNITAKKPIDNTFADNNRRYNFRNRAPAKDKRLQCHFCCKQFSEEHELAEHKRSHTGANLLKCDFCNKLFNRKQHLTKHKLTHIEVESIEIPADGCIFLPETSKFIL